MTRSLNRGNDGFSLLELLFSLSVLLVVSSIALGGLATYQQSYRTSQLTSGMHQQVRAALELMAQDIGQAGAVNSGIMTIQPAGTFTTDFAESSVAVLKNNVAVGATSLTLNMPLTLPSGTTTKDLFYQNETVRVGLGTAAEIVKISSGPGTSTLPVVALVNLHSAGDPVSPFGIFADGILATSTATKLQMYGDIAGDGTIVYAEYNCDAVNQQVTRNLTLLSSLVQNSSPQVVLSNVTNCGATPFTYSHDASNAHIVSVGITLTVQSSFRDPRTTNFLTVTKSYFTLQPRNIVLRYRNSSFPATNLQVQPSTQIPKS